MCEKHKLTRKDVYDIRSIYTSMCMLSKDESLQQNRGLLLNDSSLKKKAVYGSVNNTKDTDGIKVQCFINNCPFLSGTMPYISKRFL